MDWASGHKDLPTDEAALKAWSENTTAFNARFPAGMPKTNAWGQVMGLLGKGAPDPVAFYRPQAPRCAYFKTLLGTKVNTRLEGRLGSL
ncbi:hypothetical protein [Aquabacterium sp.]|uniref:hypothetical protein n=1 Tax=Aquabacterium sp. TaxID=1872578 RepID=UPI0019AC8F51|nr:hypothetical protein [Aquabacterium sp.]MBC7701522.1 hypothetical protein [Aquabacterium sp.]